MLIKIYATAFVTRSNMTALVKNTRIFFRHTLTKMLHHLVLEKISVLTSHT